MYNDDRGCVLLADRHHGLSEGVRGLLPGDADIPVRWDEQVQAAPSSSGVSKSRRTIDGPTSATWRGTSRKEDYP
jgi:hypothetical protein